MLCQNFIAVAVALSAVLLVPANAHPGEVEPTLTTRQLERRQAAINARHTVARKCDGAIAAFEARRRARRSAHPTKKHHGPASKDCSESATKTSTANVPTYTTLQNTTCVLTPEIDSGPYYIHEELLRTDIRDGMDGVPLLLDIGVMDVTTCTPIENALVDVWHCNTTGVYSGFIAYESSNTVSPAPPIPTSSPILIPASDQETFGRGAYPTNSNGLVEFSTVFPGFYGGRAIHIHTAVLTNYTVNANGTIGQEAGKIRHSGQVFFEESWTRLVVATEPYKREIVQRTTNDMDMFFAPENSAGYNATAQLTMLGDNLSDGLLGYVTLGVDPTASYTIPSISWYTGE